jgi:hypothetical protein
MITAPDPRSGRSSTVNFKLTAYKDEYEVARLLTDPSFLDTGSVDFLCGSADFDGLSLSGASDAEVAPASVSATATPAPPNIISPAATAPAHTTRPSSLGHGNQYRRFRENQPRFSVASGHPELTDHRSDDRAKGFHALFR